MFGRIMRAMVASWGILNGARAELTAADRDTLVECWAEEECGYALRPTVKVRGASPARLQWERTVEESFR
jgi:hypothetical protein